MPEPPFTDEEMQTLRSMIETFVDRRAMARFLSRIFGRVNITLGLTMLFLLVVFQIWSVVQHIGGGK